MSTMPASEVGNNGEVVKRSAEESSLVIGSRIRKVLLKLELQLRSVAANTVLCR